MAPSEQGAEDAPEDSLRGVRFERVTQEGDAAVDEFRNLKDRDWGRKDEGVFVVEGEMCVRNLLQHSRFPVHSLLLSERRAVVLAPALRASPCVDDATRVLVAPQPVLDSIVGFDFHRGVLAMGRRERMPSAEEVLAALPRSTRRILLAERLSNLDNVGALFRNAAALGASAVLLDVESCDPLYRKSLRVSGGHVLALPWCRTGTGPSLVQAAQAAGFAVAALTPAHDAVDIRKWWPRPARIAVLVGAEGPGLEPATQALANVRLQIPMATNVDSLNVATAAAVALSELSPDRTGRECFRGCSVS